MWPFRSRNGGDAETIRSLRRSLEEAEDSYVSLLQSRDAAEAAMRAMQKPMTEAGLAEIAKQVTAEIADIYAAAGRGVKTRDIAVHAIVRGAIRKATMGEAAWNEGMLASVAYKEIE